MTRNQARKIKLSGNFLHCYLAGFGNEPPRTEQEIIDLTDGNLLFVNAVIGILAPLRRRSVDELLDELPPRDECFPANSDANLMWATTLDLLRYARGNGWQHMPQPSSVYDAATAFRNSFNLAVAVTFEFAVETSQLPADVAKLFANAALTANPPSQADRETMVRFALGMRLPGSAENPARISVAAVVLRDHFSRWSGSLQRGGRRHTLRLAADRAEVREPDDVAPARH